MSNKIAFVCSYYNEISEIKNQLAQKCIINVDVFEYGSVPEGYDAVEYNVRPNKTHGEILDLSQLISVHGFPEDEYIPPIRTDNQEDNKEAIDNATLHLRLEHLKATIESDMPEQVTREQYEIKLEEIRSNKVRLTQLTPRELAQKFELETEPMNIIAIATVIFDKQICTDMIDNWGRPTRGYVAKNNKEVKNFMNPDSIVWMSEIWNEKFPDLDPYFKRKYIKSIKTRISNMLRDKSSIWGIRFFLDYLLESDAVLEIPEPSSLPKSDYEIEVEELGLSEENIPF